MSEHIYDQYTAAVTAADSAYKHVRESIDAFNEIAIQLDKYYATVSFSYSGTEGKIVKGTGHRPIDIDTAPTLHQIREAIQIYREADVVKKNVISQMTAEQKKILNIPNY